VVFLESQLSVDVIRRCVLLPKVCEVYKNDFENDANGCLYFCSKYLDQATVNALKRMLREEATLTIKYQASSENYHTKLILRKD
jgi:predicted DNA-binding transcriptional regulator YafY